VHAEAGNPSAALLAGWVSARLGVRAKVVESKGPGVTAVEVRFEDKSLVRIDRPDGSTATLTRTGRPERTLPLKRRQLGDLIAEELRRLDADQPYAEALQAATRTRDLNDRPAMRKHIWRDPEMAAKKSSRPPSKKSASKKSASRSSTTSAAKKSAARRSASSSSSSSTKAKARR